MLDVTMPGLPLPQYAPLGGIGGLYGPLQVPCAPLPLLICVAITGPVFSGVPTARLSLKMYSPSKKVSTLKLEKFTETTSPGLLGQRISWYGAMPVLATPRLPG